MTTRGNRRVKRGIVVSTKMANTAVVRVERTFRHPQYGKIVKSAKRYYADKSSESMVKDGDQVTIIECRPISKLKRWRVLEAEAVK